MTDGKIVGYRPVCQDCGAEGTIVEAVTEAEEATGPEAVGHV